jgi:predicted dienelactone hydrolase
MDTPGNVATIATQTAWGSAGTEAASAPAPVVSFTPVVLSAPSRGVDLSLRVSAPATGHSLPIIVFSHGNGQSMYGYGPLAHCWAAHALGWAAYAGVTAFAMRRLLRQNAD